MIGSFDVKVNESLNFYDVLGGDMNLLGDKKEFEEVKIENSDDINTGELNLKNSINENEPEEKQLNDIKNNINVKKIRVKNRKPNY